MPNEMMGVHLVPSGIHGIFNYPACNHPWNAEIGQ